MAKIDLLGKKDLVADNFLSDIINSLETVNNKLPNPTYKPSSIKCLRQMYFIMSKMPIEPFKQDYQMVGILESGSDRHIRIQKLLLNSSFCKFIKVADYVNENKLDYLYVRAFNDYETHLIDKRYNLSFMMDGLIEYQGKTYILEIKTEAGQKFYNHTEPYSEHIQQVSCYSISLGIDEALFLYEDRDLLSKKVYRYKISKSDKNTIINRIRRANWHLQKNTIPPKPQEANNHFCQYCQYRKYCK